MEFKGIGTIPYETPSDDLKPFFRRKFATVYRGYHKQRPGVITRNDTAVWADRSGNYLRDPEERANYIENYMKIFEKWVLFGKESITEKEYIECNMQLAFADAKSREEVLKEWWKNTPYFFNQLDLNKDGRIVYEEVLEVYKIFGNSNEFCQMIFNTLDANGDGHISVEEYGFAILSFHFISGPDSILSSLFGPVVTEDTL